MVHSVNPVLGANLGAVLKVADVDSATNVDGVPPDNQLGMQTFGSDGRLYVYAKVGSGGIAANQTDVTVNATTFLATDGSGSYIGPTVATVEGDYAWFAKASV